MEAVFECLSTRLFPKNQGVDAYLITGIAARCDWVVLTDTQPPMKAMRRNVDTGHPRHIFLSLRVPALAIRYFVEQVLPGLSKPFVLVSGSEDATVPHQIDQRWKAFDESTQLLIKTILEHPLLLHWVAENLDDASHPKMSPLPLGMVFPNNQTHNVPIPAVVPLQERPLRILCAHRVRSGAQWEIRRNVTRLAKTVWQPWCTVPEDEVSEAGFVKLMNQHAFVLCVEGGGVDPSPKAWQAILHGAIPIIRKTGVVDAYNRLPVVSIPDWQAQHITREKLCHWLEEMSSAQAIQEKRAQIIERLGIDYWWRQIEALTDR